MLREVNAAHVQLELPLHLLVVHRNVQAHVQVIVKEHVLESVVMLVMGV